ncbi:MAG: ribonuclease E/G [Crocinitomicaceae bacterium]|nr:ribonuclease E/G [Crocinitomicaceae bacterium]
MNKELVINATSSEVRIALLENKKLVELHEEKPNNEYSVGDIYLGKVKKLVPGLNAAFVNVGYERDAFLHYLDLGPHLQSLQKFVKNTRTGKQDSPELGGFKFSEEIDKNGNIKDMLVQGQEILVQVSKEPISTKGPRINCEVSLAGRFLILVPFSEKVNISSKIRSKAERTRLKSLIDSIKPKNFGVIIRTVAENKKVAELDQDLRDLVSRWADMHTALKDAKPPKKLLGELGKSAALLRDILSPSFNSIAIDDAQLFGEIKNYIATIAPEKVGILKQHTAKKPIFDTYGIEKQIKALFGRNVTMSSGAYLVIEHTEALHVIDVNSGNTSKSDDSQETNALRVNIESAEEIARQLRLRDMGGIIVVDFIDQRKAESRKELLNSFKEFMKNDKAKHHILPPSKFGLIQITRQRVRPEMDIKTSEVIQTKDGNIEVRATILLIDDIENEVIRIFDSKLSKSLTVKCHPFIEAYFKTNKTQYQLKWLLKYKTWVSITSSNSLALMDFHFIGDQGKEITS